MYVVFNYTLHQSKLLMKGNFFKWILLENINYEYRENVEMDIVELLLFWQALEIFAEKTSQHMHFLKEDMKIKLKIL